MNAYTYVLSVGKGRRIPLHRGPYEHEIAVFLPQGTTLAQAQAKLDELRKAHPDAAEIVLEPICRREKSRKGE